VACALPAYLSAVLPDILFISIMQLSFSQLWQQSELSDVDVLLTAPPATNQESDAPPQKLAEFPGHTVLLSTSPYLKAQVCTTSRAGHAHLTGWCLFGRMQTVHALLFTPC
jgi:hypothetical protein